MIAGPFETRELFHLEFLRSFARTVKPDAYAVKEGSNLRFFFGSIRYSVDLDLDVAEIPVHELREKVMRILASRPLVAALASSGIERVQPPDPRSAKQTETTQRFKVHLVAPSGIDLATKIEFSRRGLDAPIRAEAVSAPVLGHHRLPPLLLPHYLPAAAIRQKVRALATRRVAEARDAFDLWVLHTRPEARDRGIWSGLEARHLEEARERVYALEYPEYHDKVVPFLLAGEQEAHRGTEAWDAMRLAVLRLLEEGIAAVAGAQHGGGG